MRALLIAALVMAGAAFAQANLEGDLNTGIYNDPDTINLTGGEPIDSTGWNLTAGGASGAETSTEVHTADSDYFIAEEITPETPEPSWWSRYWVDVVGWASFALLVIGLILLKWFMTRGERTVIERARYYEEDETNTCDHCGRIYEGYSCPGCGAPRMEAP